MYPAAAGLPDVATVPEDLGSDEKRRRKDKEATKALRAEVEERIVETVAASDISPDWRPTDVGLLRPSATWTYLVTDNPFGSELERLVSSVSRRLR